MVTAAQVSQPTGVGSASPFPCVQRFCVQPKSSHPILSWKFFLLISPLLPPPQAGSDSILSSHLKRERTLAASLENCLLSLCPASPQILLPQLKSFLGQAWHAWLTVHAVLDQTGSPETPTGQMGRASHLHLPCTCVCPYFLVSLIHKYDFPAQG